MNIKIFLLGFFLALVTVQTVSAEVVTLKNGRTMTGRIIEKNQKYLVIQRGEGESAIKTTIFLDDIARIDGEESPASAFGDPREAIRNLVNQDLLLQAQENLTQSVIETPAPSLGADSQAPTASGEATTAEETEGPGEISGTISLPFSPATAHPDPGASGALYVYLTKEGAAGQQVVTFPALYARIGPQDLTSMLVPYAIKNVPFGRYQIVAFWDLASPAITEAVIGGKRTLNLTTEKGDYRGAYGTPLEISPATSDIGGINFDCSTLDEGVISEKKEPASSPKPFFEITDVYFTKSENPYGQVVMTIKNTGDQPIRRMFLAIAVASKWMPFPVVVEEIPPGAEKQVDLTPYYDQYLTSMGINKENPNGPSVRYVRIRLRMPNGGDPIFEKTVEIF